MYQILFHQNVIGKTKLENGDPPMGCVSGLICSSKSINEFASFVMECGGSQEQGIFSLELNEDFEILTPKRTSISYSAACIRICPELNEAEISLMGISYPEYKYLFPEHFRKYWV